MLLFFFYIYNGLTICISFLCFSIFCVVDVVARRDYVNAECTRLNFEYLVSFSSRKLAFLPQTPRNGKFSLARFPGNRVNGRGRKAEKERRAHFPLVQGFYQCRAVIWLFLYFTCFSDFWKRPEYEYLDYNKSSWHSFKKKKTAICICKNVFVANN